MRKGKNAFIDQKHHSIFITETDYRVMRDNVLPPSLADVWWSLGLLFFAVLIVWDIFSIYS